jgi:hypothetical protein
VGSTPKPLPSCRWAKLNQSSICSQAQIRPLSVVQSWEQLVSVSCKLREVSLREEGLFVWVSACGESFGVTTALAAFCIVMPTSTCE